jgi:molybdate transport system regulatory protein
MRISARNVLQGKIKNIVAGAVNAEVIVELPGGQEIVAVVTLSSVKSLSLREGMLASAIIKASNVMLGVD